MRAAGLDIGSRTVEFVIVDEQGAVVSGERFDTTPAVEQECARRLQAGGYDALMVTGYGRALAEIRFAAPTVTEIRAHARGA
jgi:activator of 2-hydroxyglutaryl-CoA dehydratase